MRPEDCQHLWQTAVKYKTRGEVSALLERFASNRGAPLRDNFTRLGLEARMVVADATEWQPETDEGFDGVLVDARGGATVQMPGGIPVGTLAIGPSGARNAALLAIAILANKRPELREKLRSFRAEQSRKVLRETLP